MMAREPKPSTQAQMPPEGQKKERHNSTSKHSPHLRLGLFDAAGFVSDVLSRTEEKNQELPGPYYSNAGSHV